MFLARNISKRVGCISYHCTLAKTNRGVDTKGSTHRFKQSRNQSQTQWFKRKSELGATPRLFYVRARRRRRRELMTLTAADQSHIKEFDDNYTQNRQHRFSGAAPWRTDGPTDGQTGQLSCCAPAGLQS